MQSFLDTDLHKLTLQQAVRQCFPRTSVVYRLHPVDGVELGPDFAGWLRKGLRTWSEQFVCSIEELGWLEGTGYFSPSYLDFLADYHFDSNELDISVTADGRLNLTVSGNWQSAILWEVPLLTTISELYYAHVDTGWNVPACVEDYREFMRRRVDHLLANDCSFVDSETCRRRSPAMQEAALTSSRDAHRDAGYRGGHGFLGTSNLHFARTLQIPAVGAMSQEWVIAHSVFSGLKTANRDALLRWMQVYGNRATTALVDTYSSALFFENFDRVLAEVYDSIGHNGSNPYHFIQSALTYYELRDIDPRQKTLLLNEQIEPELAIALQQFAGRKTRIASLLSTGLRHENCAHPLAEIRLAEINGRAVCDPSRAPRSVMEVPQPENPVGDRLEFRPRRISRFTP